MTTPYLNDRDIALGSLFDKPIPQDYSSKWIETLKAVPHEEKGFRLSVVIFRVQGEWLAMPSSSIKMITPPSFIHKIPYKTSELFRGVKNVEGELRLVVSLETILGLSKEEAEPSKEYTRYPRDLYFGREAQDYVFSVDEVDGIASIQSEVLEKVPTDVVKSFAQFTKAIFKYNNRSVGLLDEQLLLNYLKQNFV